MQGQDTTQVPQFATYKHFDESNDVPLIQATENPPTTATTATTTATMTTTTMPR